MIEIEHRDSDDSWLEDDDDATLVDLPPIFSPRQIGNRADHDRADPDVRAAFDRTRRFCPCCAHAAAIGETCAFCNRGLCAPPGTPRPDTHNVAVLHNGAIVPHCPERPATLDHAPLGVVVLRESHGRRHRICLWKIALIRRFRVVRAREDVTIDFRTASLLPGNVDPWPKIRPGALLDGRRVLVVERRRAAPSSPYSRTIPDDRVPGDPPQWYVSGHRPARRMRAFGQEIYFQYDRAARFTPTVLHDGLDDDDRNLDVAIAGDRLNSPFGPRIVEVQHGRGSRRPVHRLCEVVTTGPVWTAVTLAEETPADFDSDLLTRAALALLTSVIARSLLSELGAVGVYHAAIEADRLRDASRYGYDATARRGFEAIDQYVARLAEDLVTCLCGSPATPHDPGPDCAAHVRSVSASEPDPQIALF